MRIRTSTAVDPAYGGPHIHYVVSFKEGNAMMQSFTKLEPLWLAIVCAGALNWAMIGLFDTNVLTEIFGTGTLTDVVYTIVGFAGLMMVPSLMKAMHLDIGHRPHGAH